MRYADLAHLVERDLAKVEVAGSSPVIRSMKETQFVYHDILRFFAPFWRFSRFFGLFELNNGLQSSNAAVPEPVFSVFRAKCVLFARKACVHFCVSLLCKEHQKNTGWKDLNQIACTF